MAQLCGITWDHKRGYDPLIETSKKFSEQHPDISITWDKRTLAEFGDFPVEELAKKYDLLMIDHPFIGEAFDKKLFVDLQEYISPSKVSVIQNNSVGKTYGSYVYEKKVLALPVDAAALVSAGRMDQFKRFGFEVPNTLEKVISLSKELPSGSYFDSVPSMALI